MLYREGLKKRELDQEAAQIFCSGASSFVQEQSASEDEKFAAKPTPAKTDFSITSGIYQKLKDLGCIKFGQFTLKSGIVSPYYIDLRPTISKPELLIEIADLIWEKVKHLSFDLICGVPYTALPFATALSLRQNIPMVLKRKEKKEYGTKKMVEGIFEKGQKCLIVEDVITSGQSILETATDLENEGLVIEDIVVLIDREQGGKELIESKNYRLHPIYSLSGLDIHAAKS